MEEDEEDECDGFIISQPMALTHLDCKDLWDFPVSSSGGRRNSGLGLEEAPGLGGDGGGRLDSD